MNQLWHRYRISDGHLVGATLSGSEADRDHPANNIDGHAWVGGVTFWRGQRVVMTPDDFGELVVPSLVDFTPPKPDVTELVDWAWDTDHHEWVAVDTIEAVRRSARGGVISILDALDSTLARPLAEALQAMIEGAAVGEAASRKILAVNAAKSDLRDLLAAIDAARSIVAIEALRTEAQAYQP